MKFLFDNFDILAQSPGGVEKLREMILQMAVQGKLTQYWRSENTVIESQQEEIFKSFKNQDEIKTGRKQFLKKVNQVIFEDKKTPNNWVKSQFFNFCLLKRGHDLPKRKRKKGHYIVASSGGINGYHNEYIVEEGVVIGRSGSTGKAHYIEGKHWPLNTVLYGEDYCRNNKKYVYLFLKAFDFTKYSSSTAVPTLNRNKFLNELIFIPPLAEQKQIVAKVDSLMALCDHLGENLSDKEKMSGKMLSAVVSGL
ncbi:MAG: restriction endonuclease subunit S [Desulfobacteraceae bacterium]|nr:restriction endonuclease subunit S [Desulfobacteraceae bacterium]